ncbi:MAG: Gfo/Idh/MocA family oxidoreductase [Candidatus Daviesbacteria bacterium]|nr:Gfo/Idh/MocA family oxidoreductase [Candidatus Daviesbacteria bacterium]
MTVDNRNQEVVIAGPGYIGGIEAKVWHEIAQEQGINVGFIVDNSNRAANLSQELQSQLLVVPEPLTDKGHISLDFAKKIKALAEKTQIWNIAVPNKWHYAYLRLVLGAGVNRVFIEKPSTEDPELTRKILKLHPDALVQVDYVERAHPEVVAVRDLMLKEGFVPKKTFNWRSHDIRHLPKERVLSGDLTKITISDLVHDISEVDFLIKATTGQGLSDQPTLRVSELRSWQEKYGSQYPWDGDVEADFSLTFPNGVVSRIKGNDDFDQRRYFVLWDEEKAFFSQTLSRPAQGITPFAARVSGRENVKEFVSGLEKGDLVTNADFAKLLDQTQGENIDILGYEQDALKILMMNLANAKSPAELISSLSTALMIEEVVASVYINLKV